MSDPKADPRRFAPAAGRNRAPLLEQLTRLLPERARVLELASGSGEHAAWFASALPLLSWQPTDRDPSALESIDAHASQAHPAPVLPARVLDCEDDPWEFPEAGAELVLAFNMIHISPWSATEGLFRGAVRALTSDGLLITYGPYRFDGSFTAASNAQFDENLRGRDALWGVRDVNALDALAQAVGLSRSETISMPANNHLLVFRRA